MSDYRKYLKPAVWGFYIIIGLEFLFMISPFALYFYSSYGDVLNFFHRWPATAWLTGFFLPHVTRSAAGSTASAASCSTWLSPSWGSVCC